MQQVTLPHSPEAERHVLGAMMRSRDAVAKARDILTGDDFYQPAHAMIFDALCDLAAKGVSGDVVALADELERRGELKKNGDEYYLMELANSVATTVNIEHFAKIVKEKAIRRQVIRNAYQLTQEAVNGDLDALSAKAYADALAICLPSKVAGFRRIELLLDQSVSMIQERMARRSAGRAYKDVQTGIADFDRKFGGFNRGELTILAARPSEGKTLLASQIALNVAKCGNVGYVSLEMAGEEILSRSLSAIQGSDDKSTARLILQKAGDLQKRNLYLDDSPAIRIDQLAARCERLKIDIGSLDLVVVDYLQLLRTPTDLNRFPRIEKITYLSGECKALARRLDAPVLLLSQLSRECEKENRKPRLSDLRDSGSIEQDADLVMFIHRNEGIERGASGVRDILVEKNRNGLTGKFKLVFNSKSLTFNGLNDREDLGETPDW